VAQLEIPEKYTAQLQALAQQDDRSVQAVVDEALGSYIVERHLDVLHKQTSTLPVTQMPREEVAALLQRRTEQSKSGDVITSEEVDVWFSDLFKELEAR
jgi:predicted transcriptional regulator